MWVNIFIWLAIEQNNKLSFEIYLSKILGCNSPQVVNESVFFLYTILIYSVLFTIIRNYLITHLFTL